MNMNININRYRYVCDSLMICMLISILIFITCICIPIESQPVWVDSPDYDPSRYQQHLYQSQHQSQSQSQSRYRSQHQVDPEIGTIDETHPLRLVMVVHRHGDRSPVYFWPEDEMHWPDGLGQITPLGMNQLYELGKRLRHKYVTREAFLWKSYTHVQTVVRASDTDRTLESSIGLGLGLYPKGSRLADNVTALPCDMQPIPVHTVSAASDWLMRAWFNCDRYHQFVSESVINSDVWRAKEQEAQPLLNELSTYFHNETISLFTLWMYVDTIQCYFSHKMDDPRGTPRELYESAKQLNDWANSQLFQPAAGRWIGGHLLWRLVRDIEDSISETSKLKLKLYSGHDVTLASLMAGFGVQITALPSYASSIVIELRQSMPQNEGEEVQYYVSVLLNHEIVHIPGCPTNSDSCEWTIFRRAVESNLVEHPVNECRLDDPPNDDNLYQYYYRKYSSESSASNSLNTAPWLSGTAAFIVTGVVVVFVMVIFALVIAFVTYRRRQLATVPSDVEFSTISEQASEDESL